MCSETVRTERSTTEKVNFNFALRLSHRCSRDFNFRPGRALSLRGHFSVRLPSDSARRRTVFAGGNTHLEHSSSLITARVIVVGCAACQNGQRFLTVVLIVRNPRVVEIHRERLTNRLEFLDEQCLSRLTPNRRDLIARN